MKAESILPDGWCSTTLEKIASWGSGGTPSRNVERYFQGTIPWVKTGELEGKYIRETEEHISEEALKNSSAKIFPKGSVGIAMYGATIGKLSIWGINASTNQACAVGIPTEAINNEFLYYYLLSERQNLIKAGKGGAQPNLSQGIIKEWSINLPPINEQHRIVAKIEELFSELDKGIENLKTARAQLKVYRQALLKHAFEGKLTAQWRAENQDKLETADALLKRIQQERTQRYQQQLADWQADGGSKPKTPKLLPPLTAEELAELPELPEGWGWVKYGDLCSIVRNGISAKPVGESGTPIFRISAVRPLFFDMTDIRFIDNTTGEFDAYCLERGDLVFTRYNGSRRYVGVCAEYRSDEKRLFPDKLVQTRVFSKYLSTSYLEKALNSGASRKFVESKIRTTAGQSGVSGDDIKNIPVPFCSTDEQMQIVEALESKLSEVDQLDQTITTSLQQAEALRQSILKKAFSGQLVPQDPHDEPASELLNRIKGAMNRAPTARIKAERADTALKTKRKTT
ncbi:MAG: hypothetical protein A3G79_00100 [Gallionellales bacterium RIFCSPLOWO2_12_FULL_57_18]|nr:MAG: hypothetical protein A3G79_00100 [Gallionellales bacterium RIFCSPLOWO2_12_FULL_57_18]OGT09138.1 MAG: hypothetical protein A3J49_13925 [Gallionellales bacterium RIFCSPHIGHO2_02_FULL_57_16]